MNRRLHWIGPGLLLASLAGNVFAGDAAAPAPVAIPTLPGPVATLPATSPSDYLLTLGPYGALVWGAFMLGRGASLTLRVELSDTDRQILKDLADRKLKDTEK